MNIELLYFAARPNWHLAHERLSQALAVACRSDVKVRLIAVETDQEAQALNFPGSPTIHIEGHDPFPAAAESCGLTCRVYPGPRRRTDSRPAGRGTA
ncbi:thioredoxin family protein [Saccharopolyspora tripterygii]